MNLVRTPIKSNLKIYFTLKSIKNLFLIFLLLYTFGLLLLRRWLPINALGSYFDEGLFVGRAEFIISGNLGELSSGYNALVKGTVYPWYILFAKLFNQNPVFFAYLNMIILLLILSLIIFKISDNFFLSCLVYFFSISDPVFFDESASRVLREVTQQNSILFFLILFNSIFILSAKKIYFNWQIFLAIISGIILAVTTNIREENFWIYSILIVNLFFLTIKKLINLKTFLIIFFVIISYLFSIQTVKLINLNLYGVKLQNNTTEGEFPKLMLNLSSIKNSSGEKRYVSINVEKRKLAYSVSPTFAELENYLEGPGMAWIQYGCQDSQTCDDYANGWFHVALREGMKDAGWWESEKKAQLKMRQVNKELTFACSSKIIECRKGVPFGPAYGNQFLTKQELIESFGHFNNYLLSSLNNWHIVKQFLKEEEIKTLVLPEDVYLSWRKTIPSMPPAQITYINKYNSRYMLFQPYLNIWSKIFSFTIKFLFLFNLFVLSLLSLKKYRSLINPFLLTIYLVFIYIWISKGLILALNTSINWTSVSLTYSLSARIFLTLYLSLGILIVQSMYKKQRN